MKKIKEELEKLSKYILIGRENFQLVDKSFFYLSNKKSSGWLFGNQLRSAFYGRKKSISKEPLILIGGFPRSGTTLLRAMLEQHKEIASPGMEIFPFQELHDNWRLKEGFELNDKEINSLKKYKKDLILFTDKLANLYKKKKKAKRVLFKHPKYVFFIKDTFRYFPKSKIINIIRDGRDCTMSQKYWLAPEDGKGWSYSWCCRQWVTYINSGKMHRKDSRYLEIKYEDLIENPLKTINKILDFTQLKHMSKKDLLNFYKKKGVDKHKDHPGVRKPLDKKRINKWVNKMSKKDKKTFEKIAGKTFKGLGYRYN